MTISDPTANRAGASYEAQTDWTAHPPGLDQAARDQFLGHFEPSRRSGIANLFLSPIRDLHTADPSFVVTAVLDRLYRRLEDGWASEQALDSASVAAQIIQDHRDEARAFAEYYIRYEALPQTEREHLKERQREQGRQIHMSSIPPSQKQIAYLARLGYRGTPSSMAEASSLIDALARRKAARR